MRLELALTHPSNYPFHTPCRSLLELRERLLGPGAVLSTSRFLYHTVGPVYLIRWLGQEGGGHSVLPLSGDQVQEHLKLDVEALRAQPMRLAQVRPQLGCSLSNCLVHTCNTVGRACFSTRECRNTGV